MIRARVHVQCHVFGEKILLLTDPQVKVERPDPVLGVICGSLCIAEQAFRKRFADYQAHLER